MSKEKTDNSVTVRDWRVLSILEVLLGTALIWWNDTLIGSSDGNDISLLVLLLLIAGIILQVFVFKYTKAIAWRIFTTLMIILHLICVPYLVFAIEFSVGS